MLSAFLILPNFTNYAWCEHRDFREWFSGYVVGFV
eukprot:COSAG05_NODE_14053_length_409_cov_1.329032_1_plen_34_part_10